MPIASTAPRRIRTGVVSRQGSRPLIDRLVPDVRYPAVFPATDGRVVWDGNELRHISRYGHRTSILTTRRPPTIPVVIALGVTRARILAGAQSIELSDRSVARFSRFIRTLSRRKPGIVRIDEVALITMPPPLMAGNRVRPAVFSRDVWSTDAGANVAQVPEPRARDTGSSTHLVALLERLADLHERHLLSADEFHQAKLTVLREHT